MAVTITKITGIGGNPPTSIRVEGTVTGCETLHVVTSCNTNMVPVSIPSGGLNNWSVVVPNDRGCGCGASVKVTAWCGLGTPGENSSSTTLTLDCGGSCPVLTVTADTPGACANGKRSVTFHASVSNLPAGGAVLQWSFPNSANPATTAFVVNNNGPLPDQIVDYPANTSGSVTRTATLQVISPVNCPEASVNVTIDECPACCPTVTVAEPAVSDCASGSAVASFSALLTWPESCIARTPSSYEWTLYASNGKEYQRETVGPTADTSTPWEELPGGSLVSIPLDSGNYSISVTAKFTPAIDNCNPTGTHPFDVDPCCPQLIGPLNASQKSPGDPCTWLFSAQVSNPNNKAVTFEWTFQDGTTAQTNVPQVEHTYTPGSITTGETTVTLKSQDCPDQELRVTVTHSCLPCPPGQHRDANGNCVPDTPPPCPPGQHRDANGNCVPDAPPPCPPGQHRDANGNCVPDTPPPCPPGQHRDANGNCVPDTPTPPGSTCSIWCILAGIFLIAVPISAYISALAHCKITGIDVAIYGAILTLAIGVFIGFCGECCAWRFLILGAILGVIATAIAAYWLGFPGCWLAGLIAVIGFVALGLGLKVDCERRGS